MPSASTANLLERRARIALALLLCAMTLGIAGCRKRTAQAAPPTVIVPPSPEPAVSAKPTVTKTEPAPAANTTPTPPPVVTTPLPKPAPSRPKPDAPDPTPPRTVPSPQISPQLNPQEEAQAKSLTDVNLKSANDNLQKASGRQLNAPQEDLVKKIQDFLRQAGEAKRAEDWVRARNLAQKAHLLSIELVNSL